jgi:hypothetical protein
MTTRYQPSDSGEQTAPRDHSARRTPRRGDQIGRFTVLELLGRGGMGLVLSAYDPNLDRRVALKLVRSKVEASDPAETCARLMNEARAMARLRHPNVLTIYEVGEEAGRVYFAMQQVEGGSLRDRQARLGRERTSSWRSILDLYVPAGRGLAAAHAAGIVHRDFKPDNVLVDGEGGVLVADFGLAFAAERPHPRVARGTGPTRIPVAREWIGLGTPGYISSEQYLGRVVDARADQFAFCVSLWEALYAERPFAGDDEAAYVRELMAGRVRPARAERGVPTWIRDVLARGLRPDPEDRYPSMDALLAELECDDPSAVRGSRTLGMIALMVLFTVLGAYPAVFAGDRGVGGIAISIGIALAGFLLIAAILRGRERLTPFNRHLFAVLFTSIAMSLAVTGGAAMLGLPEELACRVLLLSWSAMAAVVAAALGVWLWIASAAYAAAFVLSCLVPGVLHVAIAAAHCALMLNAIGIWGGLPAQGKTGSGSKLVP